MDVSAQWIAFTRSQESKRLPSERLFEDPYAHAFVTEACLDHVDLMESLFPPMPHTIRLRTRCIDDCIQEFWKPGAQLVTLGSGADMRPHRMNLEDGIYFEVDRQDTIEDKELIITNKLNLDTVNVTKIVADFEKDSLNKLFEEGGVGRDVYTIFVMEGLVHYLWQSTHERMHKEMVENMRAPFVALVYYNTRAYRQGKTNVPALSNLREHALKSAITKDAGIDDIKAFAAKCGMVLDRDISVTQMKHRYAPDSPFADPAGEHFRLAVLKGNW